MLPTGTPETQWASAVEFVRAQSPRHGKSLSFARLVGVSGHSIQVSFPKEAAFHRATVFGPNKALIESLLTAHRQQPTTLTEVAPVEGQPAQKSIAENEASAREVRENDIEGKVRAHGSTKAVIALLGGAIEHIQVLEVAPVAEPVLLPPRDEEG